jgi:hypothetical protein
MVRRMTDSNDDLLQQLIAVGSLGSGEPRSRGYVGTKALMLAVLEEGIRNYCGPPGRVRTEAEAWVGSNRRSAFSFIVICEMLDFEPDAVRAALPRLQKQARAPLRRVRPSARRTQTATKRSP